MPLSIGIIGAGNMGEAFVGAMLAAKLFAPSEVQVSDISGERLKLMEASYGIRTTHDNAALFRRSDIVILAIKPQQMGEILSQIAPREESGPAAKKVVISIAAGIRIEKIESSLYAALSEEGKKLLPIIRVMPNTPALVLKGVSGLCANRHASPEDMEAAHRILAAMGTVIIFDESDLDAVTALSGSGPAYLFFLAESMIGAGIRLGLTPGNARDLTLGTLKGAVAMMEAGNEAPEALRRKVTSPGGTTEAAFRVFDKNNVRQVIIDAVAAAADRSRELSQLYLAT
jgi:pyrroline-5-carboxylate reductase